MTDIKQGDTLLLVPRHNYSGPAFREVRVRKVLTNRNVLIEGDTKHQWRRSYQDSLSATGSSRFTDRLYIDSPERRSTLQAEVDERDREKRARLALHTFQTFRPASLSEAEVAALEALVRSIKERQEVQSA